MSLSGNVHQLTRPHLKTGPGGKQYMIPALLDELRGAVTPGDNGSSGGKTGPPIPISIGAIELQIRIENEVRVDYNEMMGASWRGDLTGLLQHIATIDLAEEWRAYLERVTLEYVDRITAFIWPTKPRRKLTGIECPACMQTKYGEHNKVCLSVGCWDENGAMLLIGDWTIQCDGCDASWAGPQVSGMLARFNTPQTRKELTMTEKHGIVSRA